MEKKRQEEALEKRGPRTDLNIPGLYTETLPFDVWRVFEAWEASLVESLKGDKEKFNQYVSSNSEAYWKYFVCLKAFHSFFHYN
jgi:hypothetical protein